MGKYYKEKGNRSNVEFKDISPNVVNALIATEDERFYQHSGIDGYSVMRAVVKLGRDGGGSTLTQQLAKNLLDQGSKNFVRRFIEKLKEWIIAIKLERNFTKQEILALYLNEVPFGDNLYGIRNASRTFFQKEPDRLTVDEAAILIGMLKGNTLYNPRRNPKWPSNAATPSLTRWSRTIISRKSMPLKFKSKPIDLSNYKKVDEKQRSGTLFPGRPSRRTPEMVQGTQEPRHRPTLQSLYRRPEDLYDDQSPDAALRRRSRRQTNAHPAKGPQRPV